MITSTSGVALMTLANPTGRVGSRRRVSADERLEVGARLGRDGLRLVGDAPDHDARVVLVARDELADRLAVGLLGARR